jgi:cell volume regulation protein A
MTLSQLYLALLASAAVVLASIGAARAVARLGLPSLLLFLLLGNAGLPHRSATRSFAEGLGWLAQIGLFVLLGLLITPRELPGHIGSALIVGGVLLAVARPLSVVLCLAPFRFAWRNQAVVSWAGLRGAVPIVLATYPVVAGVPGSDQLLDVVFVTVVLFTLLQGPTLPAVARRLRLTGFDTARELQIEAAPLDRLDAELLTLTIPSGSRLHAVSVFELRLPAPTVVSLIIRDGRAFVPDRATPLARGDELLIVTTTPVREATECRLRAVSRKGRLARWFGERGDALPT